MNDWIIVGRFGRPHGLKGLVKVISFTEPFDNLLNYPVWYAYIKHEWQLINVQRIEVHHSNIVVHVEGYDEREDVARLTNTDIAIKQEALPDLTPGEYYWHELIGMQVVSQQGHVFGLVTEILPTGGHDVLVVVGEAGRCLIPYLLDRFVLKVDKANRVITVDWDQDF